MPLSEEQIRDMVETISAIKEKLAKGYNADELRPIIDEQIKLSQADRRSSAVGGGEKFDSIEKAFFAPHATGTVKDFQEKSDDVYILSKYLGKSPKELKSFNELQEIAKSINTGAGYGAEWIPTGFSARLIEKVRLELKVAALFDEIPMPTNPYKPPVLSGDIVSYLVPESTSDQVVTTATIPPSQVTTANFQFTAAKIAARVRVSDEADEDSIIPMLPTLRNNIALAQAQAIETAIINGDTTATHQDSDVTDAKDARKAWKGLRKLAAAGSKTDSATFNVAALRTIRKKMGVYGVDPKKLAWIVSMSIYMQMLGFTEVLTMEKYGSNATIVQGELGKLDNIPIIVSEYVRQDLNATGVYDGSTTTKSEAICVNHRAYLRGNRRGMTLESGRDIENGQNILVASMREDFEAIFDASTQYAVGIGYNVTS
jgi:HK97 family phage major capsid protein